MTDLRTAALGVVLRLTKKRAMATAERARRRMEAPKKPADPPESLRRGHEVVLRTVGGFSCYTVRSTKAATTGTVLYVHGGSYISEISSQHWTLIERLAATGARVEVPIFGLAPVHTYRDAYPLLGLVYDELTHAEPATPITIMGDSSGGGLALGFTQTLIGQDTPMPSRLTLIAPWVDLTLSNPDIKQIEPHDPWLSRPGLVEAGRAWAGGDDPTHPRLSPLYGEVTGLPPTDIVVGTRDILYPDVIRLRDRLSAAGVPVRLAQEPGAFHVHVLLPLSSGRRAAAALAASVNDGWPDGL